MFIFGAGQSLKTWSSEMLLFCAGRNTPSFKNEFGTFINANPQDYEKLPTDRKTMKLFCAGTDMANSTKDEGCEKMFYFAAAPLGDGEMSRKLEESIGAGLCNRLLSYADMDKIKGAWDFWLNPDLPGKKLFLDSGAFSAFTRGAVIDVAEYVDFIKKNEKELFCYAALDVIGDWEGTRANYEKMLELGVDPIPCYHYGSPLDELDRYCKDGVKYLALGGLVPHSRNRPKLQAHLDRCWGVLKKYFPIKVHAFGITSQWALDRYPFYSCDSTAAIMGGGMGRVLIFDNHQLKNSTWEKMGKRCRYPDLVDGLYKDGSQHLNRRIHNVRVMIEFEKYITDLWRMRGITWND
jgi:hypothetical protein